MPAPSLAHFLGNKSFVAAILSAILLHGVAITGWWFFQNHMTAPVVTKAAANAKLQTTSAAPSKPVSTVTTVSLITPAMPQERSQQTLPKNETQATPTPRQGSPRPQTNVTSSQLSRPVTSPPKSHSHPKSAPKTAESTRDTSLHPTSTAATKMDATALANALEVPDPLPISQSQLSGSSAPPKISAANAIASAQPLTLRPTKIQHPKPLYPAQSRAKGEAGSLQLRVRVLPSGQVGQVELMRSSGFAALDNAALQTVQDRWRYRWPSTQPDSAPSATWVDEIIEFRLND